MLVQRLSGRERPHELSGLRARLAARIALHNFSIWLNEQLGRPRLAFADLLGGDLETHTKRLRGRTNTGSKPTLVFIEANIYSVPLHVVPVDTRKRDERRRSGLVR